MKTFCCYSHEDEEYLKNLHRHLKQLERDGLISLWYDRQLLAGSNLDSQIMQELESSELFLFLVSSNSIASNYCYEVEFETALHRAQSESMILVPIILEPCDWRNTPLARLIALPKDGMPISEWSDSNKAFHDVAEKLRELISKSKDYLKFIKPDSEEVLQSASGTKFKTKKQFNDVDFKNFIDDAADKMESFFWEKIKLLEANAIPARLKKYDDGFECTVANENVSVSASLQVFSSGGMFDNAITYSHDSRRSDNSSH